METMTPELLKKLIDIGVKGGWKEKESDYHDAAMFISPELVCTTGRWKLLIFDLGWAQAAFGERVSCIDCNKVMDNIGGCQTYPSDCKRLRIGYIGALERLVTLPDPEKVRWLREWVEGKK